MGRPAPVVPPRRITVLALGVFLLANMLATPFIAKWIGPAGVRRISSVLGVVNVTGVALLVVLVAGLGGVRCRQRRAQPSQSRKEGVP